MSKGMISYMKWNEMNIKVGDEWISLHLNATLDWGGGCAVSEIKHVSEGNEITNTSYLLSRVEQVEV